MHGRIAAVKVIEVETEDFKLSFKNSGATIKDIVQEIRILQQLHDAKAKNINPFFEAFQIHSQLWMVSEYCPGGSLSTLVSLAVPNYSPRPPTTGFTIIRTCAKRIVLVVLPTLSSKHRSNSYAWRNLSKRIFILLTPKQLRGNGGKFQEKYILAIARELAVGLHAIHEAGIIHRDLKCANVMVHEKGYLRIIDFGVSGVLQTSQDKRSTVIGTPHWMPPELHKMAPPGGLQYGTEVS